MRVSHGGLSAATASSSLVPLASITSGAYAACGNNGGVMDNQGNCLLNPAVINTVQQACVSSGGHWNASSNTCSSTLPEGYNPTTGTVAPSNTGGTTQTVPQSTIDLNAALEAQCINSGGLSWDVINGCTMPPPAQPTLTDYTPYYIAGGIALFALLMLVMRR